MRLPNRRICTLARSRSIIVLSRSQQLLTRVTYFEIGRVVTCCWWSWSSYCRVDAVCGGGCAGSGYGVGCWYSSYGCRDGGGRRAVVLPTGGGSGGVAGDAAVRLDGLGSAVVEVVVVAVALVRFAFVCGAVVVVLVLASVEERRLRGGCFL